MGDGARVWRVDVSQWQSYDVDEKTLLAEFGSEWEDARGRGLDEEAFVKETVDVMLSYLHESPDIYQSVSEHFEVDIALTVGAPLVRDE